MIRSQDAENLVRYYPVPHNAYLQDIEETEQIHLIDYWRILVKRRWTILAFTMAVITVTAIATWKATPVYRSTIKIQIDPEQTNILPFKEAVEAGSTYAQSQEYLQTQFKVLESETLAERIIRALNLASNSSFMEEVEPIAASKTVEWIRQIFGLSESEDESYDSELAETKKFSKMLRTFSENLTVVPIRNSRLVEVSYEARDPKLAAEIAMT